MFDKRMLISKYLLLSGSRASVRHAASRKLVQLFVIIRENVTYIINIYRQRNMLLSIKLSVCYF